MMIKLICFFIIKILNLKNLAYLQHEDYRNLIENVLELESQEEIDFGHKQISKD